jgi:hypothetical protein
MMSVIIKPCNIATTVRLMDHGLVTLHDAAFQVSDLANLE